ncbi:MAG: hypothetical protein U0271_06945 [Polyangiaceae bacterium]
MLRSLAVALLVGVSAACGGAVAEVQVAESVAVVVSGQPVTVQRIARIHRFRQGRRIELLEATLYVREPQAIRRQAVIEGDDVIIGGARYLVVHIEPGTSNTLGTVLLREAPAP